jgi:two-component system chemotaxis response regulator CheB
MCPRGFFRANSYCAAHATRFYESLRTTDERFVLITVREAIEGESIQPGVYIAPAGMHMTVERPSDSRAVICLDTPSLDTYSVESHVPSVDVLMKSVAKAFGNRALGVIMTGMGSDGAEGMTAIRQMGGMTIGQDEASFTVYSMPEACAELGVLSCLVPLLQIPLKFCGRRGIGEAPEPSP